MPTPFAIGAVLVASTLLVLGSPRHASAEEGHSAGVFERDAVEVQAPTGLTFGQVRIDNHLGNVSVRGHDHQSIAIQSFKRADDNDTLERLVVSLVPDGQGRVTITTALRAGAEHEPVRAGSIAVDLVVFVPRASAISAQIWKGQLLVSKIDNGARLIADDGRIEVKQVSGEVAADLRRGDQIFAELFGDLYANGIDGSLDLDTIRGKILEASLVRGGIVGASIKVNDIRLRSVFGDVDLKAELIPGGTYKLSSRKGNVAIQFYGQASVAVQVRAKKAKVASELDPQVAGELYWHAYYGPRNSKELPAELDLRAPTGTVVVRHF